MSQRETKVPQHNYVRKMLSLVRSRALPLDVGFHQVSVYHDDWCGIFEQRHCNCDPDIRLKYSLRAGMEN